MQNHIISKLCFLLIGFTICDDAQTANPQKTVRILTIGNSFTDNATEFLDEIAQASDHKLVHKKLHIGGSALELHHKRAFLPNDPILGSGTPYSNGETLTEALQSEDWDFITMPQLSIKSHDLATYQPYAADLADLIHRLAPQAELVFHQTWAYRSDDPRFHKPNYERGEPTNQEEMFRSLSLAYQTVAKQLYAKIIPVGHGFWLADSDSNYGYQPDSGFDAAIAKPKELPQQNHSLHVGYYWKSHNGQEELRMDGHHASQSGKYLAACIWYACLYGEDPESIQYCPSSMDPKYASFLRRIANRAISDHTQSLNGHSSTVTPEDTNPKLYRFQVRASEIDPKTKDYPEIRFTRGTNSRPLDLQHASIDTRVKPQGKLVLWLMGHNDELFVRLNRYGLHAMDVHYARAWFGTLCQPTPENAFARGDVRLEAASGRDQSDELNLELRDGAAERARRFLIWLCEENPEGNWHQFLTPDKDRIRWDKVILSGASHGSTTAARFAKHQSVNRVVMLCGPRDQDQDWQSLYSATPRNRYFGFTHVLDGGWTGDHYCRSWQLLGLHEFGPIINVDQSPMDYSRTRRLISNADVGEDAKKAHSAVTPSKASPKDSEGNFFYEPVWKYLFTQPIDVFGDPVTAETNCDMEQED
ncbi:DUF4886 domain-containing protein [Rhodopirellula sp.]|nr:DUF4886 domain-containing protein [Rhodopirellula sp.]